MEIVRINKNNISLVKEFILNAGESLKNFRYFEKRKINIVLFHKITFVLREKTKVVGYCHLEEENNIVWLGISIIENKIGQGLGNILITHLLNEAKKIKVESINLAVDEDNFKARNLYEKFGFKVIKKSKKVLIYNYKA
tara:strand:+ start:15251 stop:15667 length:417 start_codon:yes stop_codon:yes gene_type:complete